MGRQKQKSTGLAKKTARRQSVHGGGNSSAKPCVSQNIDPDITISKLSTVTPAKVLASTAAQTSVSTADV